MRSSLIALAIAGVFASAGAAAGTTTVQVDQGFGSAAVVPVQYANQYGDRWDTHRYGDRWEDRSAERSANINERESHIRAWIQRGLNDGRITNREARRLYRELAYIEAKERAFKADGRLNYREDAELNRNLDRLAENVRMHLR